MNHSDKKQLLFSLTKKDFIIQTFRSGGKGGQNQNKVETGVRIIHPDSGARGESREERSQYHNKIKAFKRLLETSEFKKWHRIKSSQMMGLLNNIDEEVNRSMTIDNLKLDIKEDGKWKTINWDDINEE